VNAFRSSYGTNCGYKRCPVSPRGFECDSPSSDNLAVGALYNVNNRGACNKMTGRCECTTGNYGVSCELRVCPGEMRGLDWGDRGDKWKNLEFNNDKQSPFYEYSSFNVFATDARSHAVETHHGQGACWNQGSCDSTLGKCNCFPGFHGEDCSLRFCPNSTRGYICDNAGICDSTSGNCICSKDLTTPSFQKVASYGKDCSLRRCPQVNSYDCDREGECDTSSGMCKCYPGRYGPDCSWRACPRSKRISSGFQQVLDASLLTTTVATSHADYGVQCNDKGTCDRLTGQCECEYGWYGADCSLKYCPEHLGLVCNNEGTCDISTGTCVCENGFRGDACELRSCQSAMDTGNQLECAGHGACMATTGICKCDKGYYGFDCRQKTCPEYNGYVCNFNGNCVHSDLDAGDGGEVIGETHVGDGFDLLPSPDGRGRFHGFPQLQHLSGSAQGKCVCNAPYYGDSCQFKTCPVSKVRQLQCDGHGECTPETGYCKCTYGYSGPDCSIGTCPEWHNRVCNNQGKCMQTNNLVDPGDHSKLLGYAEDEISSLDPFTLSDEALNRGIEYLDTADTTTNRGWGYCICNLPFYGRSCEKKRCPMSTGRKQECDGHGTCDTRVGVCQCEYGYYGKDCSHKRCPEYLGRVCNLEGVCITSDTLKVDMRTSTAVIRSDLGTSDQNQGSCQCRAPYFGAACELRRCPSAYATNDWVPESLRATSVHAEMSDDVNRGHDIHKPTEDCSGHGACFYQTGMCSCDDGWHGKACNRRECPQHNGKVCNFQGACTYTDVATSSLGTCTCLAPFFGPACQFKRCPASKARPAIMPHGMAGSDHIGYQTSKEAVPIWGFECDGHGACNQDTGRCTCDTLYSGESCERKDCPVVNGRVCNNQGKCVREDQADDNLGTCKCTWPYFGVDCSQKHCPASGSNSDFSWHGVHRTDQCDGHGVCNYGTGRCNCDDGYGGLDCAIKKGLCPMSNKNRQLEWRVCNGEGTCNHQTGNCHCYSEEYSGLDCSYRRCPFYPEVNGEECNSHGECIQAFDDRGEWTGVCRCHDGWSGKFCHELYTTAVQASSRPPPSYFPPEHEVPQGTFITPERKHIILGSEGYTEGRKVANQGGMDTNIAGNFQGKVGSYQSPATSTRSDDYYAGMHPVNVPCHSLQVTGCQHSVTHPEATTGQHSGVTQPSLLQNLDSTGQQNWRTGDGVSAMYSGGSFTAPHYSGHGGPAEQDYRPKHSVISNDVGQTS